MAFITLSGTLLDPNGDLAVGDQIRFTHKSTTGETVQSAVSVITINPAGTYSLPLQYGLVLVEYKDVRTQQFKNLGVATVNQDNPATSIPELLNALVPVSSAELIEFQAILADCVAAQLAAENAATTAEAFAYQLTTTDLIASTAIFTAETNIPTSGFTTSGDGGNGSWKQNGITGQTPSQSPAQLNGFTLNDGSGNQWQWSGGAILTDITILIPSDFATLQAAIDFIQPIANVSSGVLVNLKIEAGHSPASGVIVKNLDCGYFTITSVDAIVNLSTGFTGGSVESTATNCFIVGDKSTLPTLGCLVNANDFCDGGYVVYGGSKGNVLPSCGVTYSSKFGLYVLNDSKCNATNCDFSYVGLVNRVTTNSQLHAEGGDFSNAQDRGTPDANGDRGGLDVSRGSIVNIKTQGANITTVANSANNGLSVRRSVVSAEEILANNCAGVGVRAETGCLVTVAGSTITNCGDVGIFASFGSTVNAFNVSVAGCTNYGIQADNCATVAARDVIATGITGVGRAIYSANASTIDFRGGDASGALSVGLYAINGGAINATSATVDMTGSNAGSYAILCDYGSNVTAALGVFSNSTSGQDIRCTRGSTVAASGSTGVISKTANTVDVNGIIYK